MPKLIVAGVLVIAATIASVGEGAGSPTVFIASIVNGIRYTTAGARIDAHGGTILRGQDGLFYWYGESYACGFRWTDPDSPYCAPQVYQSRDLVNWRGPWQLFDASSPFWQDVCMHNGPVAGYGCFRPKVVFNRSTRVYVMWLNTPDGYRVFTSPDATGRFTLAAKPNLGDAGIPDWQGRPKAVDGDEGLFVDRAGVAWLVWSRGGRLLEERLDRSYTTGAGRPIGIGGFPQLDPWQGAEAPSMFEHGGRYFIAMSLPRCPYCTGTGTAIERAAASGGPWSYDGVVTWDSCGGQPNEVDLVGPGSLLWSSDQWSRSASAGVFPRLNETLATQAWEPLQFDESGHVKAIDCSRRFTIQA